MTDDNKRLYKRVALGAKLKATVVILGDHGRTETTQCAVTLKDFSKSGAGVYTMTPIPKQSLVTLAIEGVNLPPLHGRVVWTGSATAGNDEEPPPGLPYRIGIDFMPKDDAARENQLETYQQISELAARMASKGEKS